MNTAIDNLLNAMRVRSTAYIAKNLKAPWGVHIDDHPHLARFHLVISGSTWISMPGGSSPEKLNVGDIAIIPKGKAHDYFDSDPSARRVTKSYPTEDGHARFELLDLDSTDTHLLCGYFEISDYAPSSLVSRLPDLLIGRRDDPQKARKFDLIVDLAQEELAGNPSQVALNRLTEMLCVHTIQDWFEGSLSCDEKMQALVDPKTKIVIDEIQKAPRAPWTVDALARLHGQSRTAFTTHFKMATGMSPMSYVRQWRIKLACRMLEQSTLSIDEIAFKSGYADTNAFNRAFKREVGVSPGAFKRKAQVNLRRA